MRPILTFFCFLGLFVASAAIGDEVDESVPTLDAAEKEAVRSELAQLLERLDSDAFKTRRRASKRIEQLVARPKLRPLLAREIRQAALALDISFELRWQLQRWSKRLPEVFIEPPADLSAEEIGRLIEKLDDDSYAVRLGAAERIRWLLMRDEHVVPFRKALEKRLSDSSLAEPPPEVRKLADMTRPAMVAEYWQAGRCMGQQHLLIGVPSQSPTAPRPSHFDRIDDNTAHCVSGVNLSPGDYPVGVAIVHPNTTGALFHLVNLPTPRRRKEYEQLAKTDEGERLKNLSRRTFDRMLRLKHELTSRELTLLAQLDPSEVSRFAGKYFNLVPDKSLPDDARPLNVGRPSRFGVICAQLAANGTREAVPGLLEAIDGQRFLPPSARAPYRLHWLAALSIAARDPWPDADAWLADQIDNREPLVEGHRYAPDLGATAAGLLLRRHDEDPKQYGLRPANDAALMRMGIDGFRFESSEGRAKVERWWQEAKKNKKDS